jgi:hypothetical protein
MREKTHQIKARKRVFSKTAMDNLRQLFGWLASRSSKSEGWWN